MTAAAPRIRATFPPLRDVSPVVLDNVAILARLRDEVVLYTPDATPCLRSTPDPRGGK